VDNSVNKNKGIGWRKLYCNQIDGKKEKKKSIDLLRGKSTSSLSERFMRKTGLVTLPKPDRSCYL
jgi:hypothetical protein